MKKTLLAYYILSIVVSLGAAVVWYSPWSGMSLVKFSSVFSGSLSLYEVLARLAPFLIPMGFWWIVLGTTREVALAGSRIARRLRSSDTAPLRQEFGGSYKKTTLDPSEKPNKLPIALRAYILTAVCISVVWMGYVVSETMEMTPMMSECGESVSCKLFSPYLHVIGFIQLLFALGIFYTVFVFGHFCYVLVVKRISSNI